MASFRESVEALKEAGLVSSCVDNQLNGSISISKTNLNNSSNKCGRALPQEDINSNAETLTVCKKKAGVFSSENYVRI